ncbi:MAG: biopolymer transporter ExbB [Pseudomonadota bacterium]
MTASDAPRIEFSPPTRQILPMATILVVVFTAAVLLAPQVKAVFNANPYLNGVICAVFVIGVLATFLQIGQLRASVTYLRDIEFNIAEGNRPPQLLLSMAPMIREGRLKSRLSGSAVRTIVDSVATRLDEARDITRYIVNFLILIGLLGTFWGLSQTVPAVVNTITNLVADGDGGGGDESGAATLDRLLLGLNDQLDGMGTAFASSLLGLAGSLVVGLLELFAGHGQNRFFRELEEWLSNFTRLGLVNEGEGPESALVAILERVDEGLEKTVEFATKAEVARIEAESRLARAADVVAEMANQIEIERSNVAQMVNEMREARENQQGRDYAQLNVLKRIDAAQATVASGQQAAVQMLERVLDRRSSAIDQETKGHLRNLDSQLRQIADEMTVGRHEAVKALRGELRTLIQLIDVRTSGDGR